MGRRGQYSGSDVELGNTSFPSYRGSSPEDYRLILRSIERVLRSWKVFIFDAVLSSLHHCTLHPSLISKTDNIGGNFIVPWFHMGGITAHSASNGKRRTDIYSNKTKENVASVVSISEVEYPN